MAAILKILNIKHSFILASDMKKSYQIMPITSSMTSQGGLKVSLYIHV